MHEDVIFEPIADERELKDSLDDMETLMQEIRTGKNHYGEKMTPDRHVRAASMLASYCLSVAHYLENRKP